MSREPTHLPIMLRGSLWESPEDRPCFDRLPIQVGALEIRAEGIAVGDQFEPWSSFTWISWWWTTEPEASEGTIDLRTSDGLYLPLFRLVNWDYEECETVVIKLSEASGLTTTFEESSEGLPFGCLLILLLPWLCVLWERYCR